MTTVLDSSSVPGVRTLFYLAVALAAISGALCIAFLGIIAVNYHGLLVPGEIVAIADRDTPPAAGPSYRLPADDSFNRLPTDYQSFRELRHALTQNRQNAALIEQIRQLDHELRTSYFQRRAIAERTTIYLIAASILFFVAVRTITTLKRRIPDPSESVGQTSRTGYWGVAVATAWLMLFGGLCLGFLLAPKPEVDIFVNRLVADANAPVTQPAVPTLRASAPPVDATTPQVALPFANVPRIRETALPSPAIELTEELLMRNWVSFRNFDGNGVGFSDNPPIHWDAREGTNIVWQTEVPLPGNSSPVIWTDDAGGGKLFLTGADENTQEIYCFDITDGSLLWIADVTREVVWVQRFEDERPRTLRVDDCTGYAAPTPVVDGRHVYAMFASGELVAVNFSGQEVWRKSFGLPDNTYGYASSLALHYDRLIVQFDDGEGVWRHEDGTLEPTSKLVALDLNDGSVIWETPRDLPNTWASPTIKRIGDSYQIITNAGFYAIAYNPEDGSEIWRVRCLSGDIGPSAVSLGNIVFIANENPRATAIDATGTGNITATHVLWTGVNSLPCTTSPLITEDYVLTLHTYGWLTGYDPNNIEMHPTRGPRARFWELEMPGTAISFYSSPLRVGNFVYFFCKTGTGRGQGPRAFVIDLSKIELDDNGDLTTESEAALIIAINPMPEPVVTSPAILNNRIYIRSETMIFCIGE